MYLGLSGEPISSCRLAPKTQHHDSVAIFDTRGDSSRTTVATVRELRCIATRVQRRQPCLESVLWVVMDVLCSVAM